MSKSLSVEQIAKVGPFSIFSLFDDRRLKVEMLMLRIDDQTFP
jgi:hypothetical protein